MFSWDKHGAQYFMKQNDPEMSALHTTFLTASIYLIYFALIFGKKISNNQEKWALF